MPFWFSWAFVYIQLCLCLFPSLLYLLINDCAIRSLGKHSHLFGNPSVFELLEDSVSMTNVYILLTLSVLQVFCWIFGLVHYFSRSVSLVASSKYWFRLLEPISLQLRPLVALFFMAVNFLIFSHLTGLV